MNNTIVMDTTKYHNVLKIIIKKKDNWAIFGEYFLKIRK